MAEEAGYFEAAGRYVPNVADALQQLKEHGDPTADSTVLGAVRAPVVVLYGSGTKPFFVAGARHVANHVPDGRAHEIPGTGHAAPVTHPEALAKTLTGFFTPAHDVEPNQ